MDSSKDKHKQRIKDKKMLHSTRKRKASGRLENINDLTPRNKRPRCWKPASPTTKALQSKAPSSSPRARHVAPHRPARSPPMADVFPIKAPLLPPRTSKPSPTDMGHQSLELHIELTNEQDLGYGTGAKMDSSKDKHKQRIKEISALTVSNWSHDTGIHDLLEDTHKLVTDKKMLHSTRKRKASGRLENINDLTPRNKQPRCRKPTLPTTRALRSKAPPSSPRALHVAPHRPARSPPMTDVFPIKAPLLPPRTSKPSPTDMGHQSLELHIELTNEQEGLVKKSNPTIDQQKVKENRHMAHNVCEEDQTVDQQSENIDTVDNGKAKNGKLCQNIDKSDKSPKYVFVHVNEVVHYKVPLKTLPRMHRLQGFVGTLTNYCEGIENKLGLPNMGETGMEHREYIDIFIQDNTFDMNLLIADHEDLDYTNTKIYQIASRERDVAGSKSVGLFVNSEGIQFVDSVTDSTLFVYSDSHLKKEEQQANAIGSMMEVIIMRPLLDKVALFHRLRRIIHSERNGEEFSAASLIRDLYPNSTSSLITANATTDSDLFYQCIQQNKSNIERLLGEMIALSKRSNLPEEIKPVFEEYQTTNVPEEVARDLFKLDKAITWCGFRYSTFHIYVKHTSHESKKKKLAKKISTFLAAHGIMKHELIYSACDLEEYSYIGSVIRSRGDQARRATLGCFATFKSSNSSSVCALTAKHFARKEQSKKYMIRITDFWEHLYQKHWLQDTMTSLPQR